jgi:hypothetical protein
VMNSSNKIQLDASVKLFVCAIFYELLWATRVLSIKLGVKSKVRMKTMEREGGEIK